MSEHYEEENLKKTSDFVKEDWIDIRRKGTWHTNYEQQAIIQYLGVDDYRSMIFAQERVSVIEGLYIRFSLDGFLKERGFKIEKAADLGHEGDYPPSYSNIEYEYQKYKSCLYVGCYFIEKDGFRYILDIDHGPDYTIFKLSSRKDSPITGQSILADLLVYSKKSNFLKGQKMDAKCKFISFDRKYSWDDLVLDENHKDEIRRNLANIIEHSDIYEKNGLTIKRGLIFYGNPGCHAKGTKILMYDGTIKNVEDIVVSDKLMGSDSTPRQVLALSRGRDQMLKVIPTKGEEFVVNSHHIFHLQPSGNNIGIRCPLNLSGNQLLNNISQCIREKFKLKRIGVDFSKKEISIPPYILGLWLGDGTSTSTDLTIHDNDVDIITEWIKYGESLQLSTRTSRARKNANCQTYHLHSNFGRGRSHHNKFLTFLKSYNLIGNKHIPFDYLTSSKKDRLELLAGLIDTDGTLVTKCDVRGTREKRGVGFSITTEFEHLADQIVFLCRSLGFAAYKSTGKKGCYVGKKKVFEGTYYFVSISGDCFSVPLRLKRKHCSPRKSSKDVLRSGFRLELLPEDDYYGFALDKDHLYLTADFTIHHNTGKTLLGKILCNVIDWTFVWVTPRHLQDARDVTRIVSMCRDLSPTILFLEDIDLFGGNRHNNSNVGVLGELMNQLDGIQENRNIITIATTNNVEVLEKALLKRPGRFDRVIEFTEPKGNNIVQMLKLFSKGVNLDPDVNFDILAKSLQGLTGAQIKELVSLAILYAIDVKSYNENKVLFVKISHFQQALPSVKKKDYKSVGFTSRHDDDDDLPLIPSFDTEVENLDID